MQLSLHADYAFRVLIYLGTHRDRSVRTQDISDAYGISKHHLVRVVQTLGEHGYVRVHAGRSGGVALGREPHQIRLGQVARHAEPDLRLVECFDGETNTCPIAPACMLKGVLAEALQAFLETLDRYTLADVLTPEAAQKFTQLLTIRAAAPE
jgi:Rrf2 family transcriptional regulator, nitric oxide-sensitive transcriptional repressor